MLLRNTIHSNDLADETTTNKANSFEMLSKYLISNRAYRQHTQTVSLVVASRIATERRLGDNGQMDEFRLFGKSILCSPMQKWSGDDDSIGKHTQNGEIDQQQTFE